ncbi:UNVERIFIED_ORG: type 1 fimbria pilin [Providencia alcalifaciens]
MKSRAVIMINVSYVIFLLVILISPTSWGGRADNLHLYGTLVAEPCVIPPGDDEIDLDFGTVIDKYLYLNKRTLGQPFSIHLAECDLSLGRTVRITFLGKENSMLPGLLAVDENSQAKGIAIGLETLQAKPIPINKTSNEYLLQEGDTIIAMKAYVQGEPDAISNKSIKRGLFSSTATFRLDYE